MSIKPAAAHAAAARSVRSNGRDIDPVKPDWSAISAEIAEKLPKQIKQARLTTPADLARVAKRSSRKERYPGQDIDKAWVSGNATDQHAKLGSDGFGYDFRLELDRRTWLMEVKASQGDSCRFEMGESEAREARKAMWPRAKERYVVVYVADPGNSAATKIDVLTNPFSDESAKVPEILG